jgi:hypothetical protein
MARRLFAVFLALAPTVCAQRRVDPRNTYHRVICVVPIIGYGTPSDPKRPHYAPWPPASGKSQMDIVGFSHQLSDNGKIGHRRVRGAGLRRDCGSLHDHSLEVFEKGVHKNHDIETEMKKLMKDFSLDKFGMVMTALHLAATSLLGMLLVNPAWAAYEFYFTDNLTLHQYLKLDAGGGRGGNQQWAHGGGLEWRFADFAAVGSG